jgi:hypothetical protein
VGRVLEQADEAWDRMSDRVEGFIEDTGSALTRGAGAQLEDAQRAAGDQLVSFFPPALQEKAQGVRHMACNAPVPELPAASRLLLSYADSGVGCCRSTTCMRRSARRPVTCLSNGTVVTDESNTPAGGAHIGHHQGRV